jgi:hypothetical protein
MYGAARYYAGPGAKELADLLESRKSDVQNAIKAAPGFVSYALIRLSDGGVFSLTTCNDKAGCDESTRIAGEWVRANAGDLKPPAPMVSEGEVIIRM